MNRKILLVDDDPDILRGYTRLLGRDYDVAVADNADQAMQVLSSAGPFAVVISDFDMPAKNGLALLSEVRAQYPTTTRLMLTGFGDRDVAIQSFEAGGVFRFLDKPIEYTALRSALESALREHERALLRSEENERLAFSCDALLDFVALLEGRLEQQSGTLERLRAFARELSCAGTLEEIAQLAAEACSNLLLHRGVFVELVDLVREGVRCQASVGPELGAERFCEEIRSSDGSIGSLQVERSDAQGRRLSETDRNILASIAASTAVAVHNRLRRRERDEAQHATILALACLAEQRDNETGKHLERVSRYCRLVAEGLREDGHYRETVSDAWIEDLYRSAPLHDIGKVGIPDAILLKPGKLAPDEWAIMKTHTTIGADTLRSVIGSRAHSTFLQMSLDIAWCHHEKWDGSGYPRGLAGRDIPLSARILALADVYDALTSARPYKRAWTHAESVAWIRGGAGSHFDPDVAAAFLARAGAADVIRAELADPSA